MICLKCKHEIEDDAKFCSHCGIKIKRCPSCHQPLFENAKYCSHCGKDVYKPIQEEHLEGYYQPINHQPIFEEEKSKVVFQDIQTEKKINIPVILLSVLTLIILTVWGYGYLDKTKNAEVFKKETTIQENPQHHQILKIKGTTSEVSMRANLNQGGHVLFYKDRLYMNSDDGQFVSMNNQLQDRQILYKGNVEYVNIVDDVIYYTNENDQLCSMDIDGKNQKVILNKKVFYVVVKENKIYYQFDTDQERIYVYDLKTNEDKRLNERHSYNLNVIDDKIYYTSSDGIYCLDINSKNDQKLLTGKCSNMVYHNQKLYFGTSDFNIRIYDIANKEVETLEQQNVLFMNMNERYIFYSYQGLMRYDMETKEIKRIYNGNINACEIVGDQLIVTANGYDSNHRVIMDFDGIKQQRLFQSQDNSYI